MLQGVQIPTTGQALCWQLQLADFQNNFNSVDSVSPENTTQYTVQANLLTLLEQPCVKCRIVELC
jgi:hypothetical protein